MGVWPPGAMRALFRTAVRFGPFPCCSTTAEDTRCVHRDSDGIEKKIEEAKRWYIKRVRLGYLYKETL